MTNENKLILYKSEEDIVSMNMRFADCVQSSIDVHFCQWPHRGA